MQNPLVLDAGPKLAEGYVLIYELTHHLDVPDFELI